MTARLVEILLPEEAIGEIETVLPRHSRRWWREAMVGEGVRYGCIVQQRYTERLLEALEARFGHDPRFSVTVARLEATLPPIEEDAASELPAGADLPSPTAVERFFSRDRLSTNELYDDLADSLRLRPVYLLTVALSALIAGLGMRSGQTAVVIGAMVIAPLLGPAMGLALAATVGDRRLGRQAALTLAAGCLLAVAAGWAIGATIAIDPLVPELRNRTIVYPSDIALALACGTAGVLAFSKGTSLSLVGVMIAVALVPPLAAAGIYLGAGWPLAGWSALYLFGINLVCVNIAGIATFLLQGLPPKNWRFTTGILLTWGLLLALLVSMIAGTLLTDLGSLEAMLDYLRQEIATRPTR